MLVCIDSLLGSLSKPYYLSAKLLLMTNLELSSHEIGVWYMHRIPHYFLKLFFFSLSLLYIRN